MDEQGLYFQLLKLVLADLLFDEPNKSLRVEGREWPTDRAMTMIGLKRLDNLQHCVEDVLLRKVPGDLIETGVWRGGATIFMRAILKARNELDRRVWVADSFEGLPKPNTEAYPADTGDTHHERHGFIVSIDDVKANFRRFDLLDDQVRFLKGWFRDTMRVAPIEQLALLRLDGDMYESTIQVLESLYPKLAPGGYIIVDDYGAVDGCRQAVDDYREREGIREELQWADWTGIYWQRE